MGGDGDWRASLVGINVFGISAIQETLSMNTQRNIQGMATLSAALCVAGFGLVSLISWDVFWIQIGIIPCVLVPLYLMLSEAAHTRQIEIKETDAQIEIEKIRANPSIEGEYRVSNTNVMRPMIAAPKANPNLIEVQPNHWIKPEAEPVQVNSQAELNGWPSDTTALQVAFELMLAGKLPTQTNFAQRGFTSASRYKIIRQWLIEAGLAQNEGNGNQTLWTSHAWDFDTQNRIKNYLTDSPTLAE